MVVDLNLSLDNMIKMLFACLTMILAVIENVRPESDIFTILSLNIKKE